MPAPHPALIGPTEAFVDALCQQQEHVKDFRWFWYCRGVDVRKDGRRYDLRGNPMPERSELREPLEEAACAECGFVKRERTFQRDRCQRCNSDDCWMPYTEEQTA